MTNVPAGMLVYSSTDNVLYIRTNSGWSTLSMAANAASAASKWATTGNDIYSTNTGNVGIGTNLPTEALDVKGNIKYSGNLLMGIQYVYIDFDLPPSSYGNPKCSCPAGTKLIGGGGGQRDFNGTLYDFQISYNGPNKDDANQWLLIATNLNSTAVTARVYAICAKVQ
jgi:hypothetical protein